MSALIGTIYFSISHAKWMLTLGKDTYMVTMPISVDEARDLVRMGVPNVTSEVISKMIPLQQVLFT